MKRILTPVAICVTGALLTACGPSNVKNEPSNVTADSVVTHYADIAEAIYGDSLTTALDLRSAIDRFLDNPTEANLVAGKTSLGCFSCTLSAK